MQRLQSVTMPTGSRPPSMLRSLPAASTHVSTYPRPTTRRQHDVPETGKSVRPPHSRLPASHNRGKEDQENFFQRRFVCLPAGRPLSRNYKHHQLTIHKTSLFFLPIPFPPSPHGTQGKPDAQSASRFRTHVRRLSPTHSSAGDTGAIGACARAPVRGKAGRQRDALSKLESSDSVVCSASPRTDGYGDRERGSLIRQRRRSSSS